MATRKKNPSPGLYPHMNPAYPIKPMVDVASGREYKLISFADNGGFTCLVAEDTSIKVTAKTQRQAEQLASDRYSKRIANPRRPQPVWDTPEEDAADTRVCKARRARRKSSSMITIQEYMREHGLDR